jgi:adenine/guanine phosphoribosyltransferase-like PRPP-binding protein
VPETFEVDVCGAKRALPLVEVAPGVRIALFNMLGDAEIVKLSAAALAERLRDVDADVLVTAETKSIPLVYQLALDVGLPWVVLRKAYKPYMGTAVAVETLSITTGEPQTLYLAEPDHDKLAAKRVIVVDDVVSTGSTLKGMRELVALAGGEIVAEAAVFTEGDASLEQGIIALGHLPVFRDAGGGPSER